MVYSLRDVFILELSAWLWPAVNLALQVLSINGNTVQMFD
jgi:hypothetical protein